MEVHYLTKYLFSRFRVEQAASKEETFVTTETATERHTESNTTDSI